MRKLIRGILEFLRMTVFLLLFMGIVGEMENAMMRRMIGHVDNDYIRISWNILMLIGDLLLFMVLYRNYLQFRGWYVESAERLPKRVTRIMLGLGLACIFVPIVIAQFI